MNLREATLAAFGPRADMRRSQDRLWWHVIGARGWSLSLSVDLPAAEGLALTIATAVEIAADDLEATIRPLAGLNWLCGSHAIGGRGPPSRKHPEGEPRAWLPPLPELWAWVLVVRGLA